MLQLPLPGHDRAAATAWVGAHLEGLFSGDLVGSPTFVGGQAAADARLASLDIAGYARDRNHVLPRSARGASGMSPWIRHGLITLRQAWDAVENAPTRDRSKFRDELLWQEYARHWYARLGRRTSVGVRGVRRGASGGKWPAGMACIDAVVSELRDDGWLVNQTRMWLASQWAIRDGLRWQDGEDEFFRHLLDGSRAANRLGWQWTTGVGSSKSYGFSRWQVDTRAPDLCRSCELRSACPIEEWPSVEAPESLEDSPSLKRTPGDPTIEAGPWRADTTDAPDAIWLTAESLGDADPALAANPDTPAVFVFDEPLLRRLALSAKRLVFMAECVADLGRRRPLDVWVGDPTHVLRGRRLAVTFAPVPGFARRSQVLDVVELHPWPWLARPHGGTVQSFSAWRRGLGI